MNNLNKTIQEQEQQHAVFTLAPLTDDLSFSYIIKIEQSEDTEYLGVSSIEEAFESILEHPFGTATIHIKNKTPNIEL